MLIGRPSPRFASILRPFAPRQQPQRPAPLPSWARYRRKSNRRGGVATVPPKPQSRSSGTRLGHPSASPKPLRCNLTCSNPSTPRPAQGDARVNGIWSVAITMLAFIGSVSESFGQQNMYGQHRSSAFCLWQAEIEPSAQFHPIHLDRRSGMKRDWFAGCSRVGVLPRDSEGRVQ